MASITLDELTLNYVQTDIEWHRAEAEKRWAVRKADAAHKRKMELEKLLRECVSETDPVKIIDVPGAMVHVQWINGAVGVAIKAKPQG